LDPREVVRIAFDFNINPATAVIGVVRGETACVWREVYLSHLGGEATRSCAQTVKAHLTSAGHIGGVRIYGDSTGRAGKTTGPSDHQVLRDEFPRAAWEIPVDQPHVKDRIAAVNSRMETSTGLRRCLVDPSCVRLIADLEQVRFNDKGEIEKGENPLLTHVSDAFGYWMAREFPAIKRGPGIGFF